MKILICDDDDDFVQLLTRGLQRLGFDVLSANSLESILETLALQDVDVITLDLNMGTISGLTILPILIAESRGAHIYILTGYASLSTAVEAVKLGATDYLPKPIIAEELVAKLENKPFKASSKSTPLHVKEWEILQETLKECGFNKSKAAKQLGLTRRTLQRKMKKNPF